MKVYVDCIWDEELLEQLHNDHRTQIYEEELVFCLDCDREDLEQKYDLVFVDATDTLFQIFLNGRDNIADLDLQFDDILRLSEINKILFYNKFDKWLKKVEKMFYNVYNYTIENYEECRNNYYKLLGNIAKIKYQRR